MTAYAGAVHSRNSDPSRAASFVDRRQALYTLLRYVIAFVLLAAAALKVHSAIDSLRAEGRLGPEETVPILIGIGEIVLAFWALLHVHPRIWWIVATSCFCIFACIAGARTAQGFASCGCFGRFEVKPTYALALDASVIVALLLSWRPAWRASDQTDPSIRTAALLCSSWLFIALILAPSATAFARGFKSDSKVANSPEHWIGIQFPLLSSIDIGNELQRGRWVVVIYRNGCLACVSELRRYENIAQQNPAVRIALVELPPYASSTASPVSPQTRCVKAKLLQRSKWPYSAPAAFVLDEGITKYLALEDSR